MCYKHCQFMHDTCAAPSSAHLSCCFAQGHVYVLISRRCNINLHSAHITRTVRVVPFLDKGGAFGRSQWAFRPGCGCRDLVTIKFAKWIRDINSGKRIGLFLSDIKGAFDRVDSSILALKCAKVGLGETVCKLIAAWLAPRKAHVIVQGQRSEQIRIENQVYQGTCWDLLCCSSGGMPFSLNVCYFDEPYFLV